MEDALIEPEQFIFAVLLFSFLVSDHSIQPLALEHCIESVGAKWNELHSCIFSSHDIRCRGPFNVSLLLIMLTLF